MSPIRLAEIWRHPIKGHGAEQLSQIEVQLGKTLPFDRYWAVAHEAAKVVDGEWAACTNFSRGAKAPGLMAMCAHLDTKNAEITLEHPELPPFTGHPERDADALIAWAKPVMPENRASSARVVRAAAQGMTDTDFPSISILNLASLAALGERAGEALDPRRFRGNLWLSGLIAWEEFSWIGRSLRIGEARFEIRERITRCNATKANPETGICDIDTLYLLQKHWGHKDFGVYAVAKDSGNIACGDEVTLL